MSPAMPLVIGIILASVAFVIDAVLKEKKFIFITSDDLWIKTVIVILEITLVVIGLVFFLVIMTKILTKGFSSAYWEYIYLEICIFSLWLLKRIGESLFVDF